MTALRYIELNWLYFRDYEVLYSKMKDLDFEVMNDSYSKNSYVTLIFIATKKKIVLEMNWKGGFSCFHRFISLFTGTCLFFPVKWAKKSLASGVAVLLKKWFSGFIVKRLFSWWKITYLLLRKMIWLQNIMNDNFQKEYDFQNKLHKTIFKRLLCIVIKGINFHSWAVSPQGQCSFVPGFREKSPSRCLQVSD